MSSPSADAVSEGIAIIGMHCRVPGASDPETFWRNLRDGVDSVRFFSDDELEGAGVDRALLKNPHYVKAKPCIEDLDKFDAEFFGINAREAALIDPQHRIFLEAAYHALESAGYDTQRWPGLTGVFASVNMSRYLITNLGTNPQAFGLGGLFEAIITNDKDYLAPRLAYHLNLRGPSVMVQTACSGSLVAIVEGCKSLANYECDMALAGGVSLLLPQCAGYLHQEGGLFSPDGHVRPYDAKANGTVFGDGLGIVVLKRLEDALAGGDNILAVIRGWAVNNDGSSRMGFTAPGVAGQSDVIAAAQEMAQVDPRTIGFVEGHGSGTPLGDAIEVEALRRAFGGESDRGASCAIGSVKSNVGHLYSAAGVVGLIKTVLALQHQTIPPTANFSEPNPALRLDQSPFYVNRESIEWRTDAGAPRRAGVSSFGLGGTNAHVVLEEAPGNADPGEPASDFELIPISARSAKALETLSQELADHLEHAPRLSDVAHTLQSGRRALPFRRALIAESTADACAVLRSRDKERLFESADQSGPRQIAFMFSGVGDHYPNMAAGLYRDEPVFKEEFDRCGALLQPHLGVDLREIVFDRDDQSGKGKSEGAKLDFAAMVKRNRGAGKTPRRLDQSRYSQPAAFAIDYSLARLWMSWGITPAAMIGHSIGEYAAACIAGVFSLPDAAMLVAQRALQIDQLPPGGMLAVMATEEELGPLLSSEIFLAAANAANLFVVSGSVDAIETLERSSRGLMMQQVPSAHAYHSPLLAPAAEHLAALMKGVELHPPRIPYISNVTGTWITAEQATSPRHWADHTCKTVRFREGVTRLFAENHSKLVEVGAGQALTSFAMQTAAKVSDVVPLAVPSLRNSYQQEADRAFILRSVAKLWLAGVEVDWEALRRDSKSRRVSLPPYPFERTQHWIEPGEESRKPVDASAPAQTKRPLEEWFFTPSWRQRDLPAPVQSDNSRHCWLVFEDQCGLGEQLIRNLRRRGHTVVAVRPGPKFRREDTHAYVLQPQSQQHYDRLLEQLASLQRYPDRIAHCWSVAAPIDVLSTQSFNDTQDAGFGSILCLARAMGNRRPKGQVRLLVISNGLHDVYGGEQIEPAKATLLGASSVIPKEYDFLDCRSIDLELPNDAEKAAAASDRIIAESFEDRHESVVALRGSHRWIREFARTPLAASTEPTLRERGVYIITGGLGGIGLGIAAHLAEKYQARLVLVGRSGLPDRSTWSQWLGARPDDPAAQKIAQIQKLESAGAEVEVSAADVSDVDAMRSAIAAAKQRFGSINGVVHAAGVPGSGLIQLKTSESVAAVLKPKCSGLMVLETVLADEPLDFVALFSSELAICPMIGQADYAAANAFLDAYAHHKNGKDRVRFVSINWSAWQWDAWQSGNLVNLESMRDRIKEFRSEFGISFSEGAEALERALRTGFPQVAVATVELGRAVSISPVMGVNENGTIDAAAKPVPGKQRALTTEYVGPRSEIEQRLAELWALGLGLDRVGIHDNFLEIGGHSLLAAQIISRVRDNLGAEISMNAFFEHPTVARMASLLENAPASTQAASARIERAAGAEADEQSAQEIEDLSDEELDRRLESMMSGAGK
ncbi:MAG: SDR family NAD(P)-dependent oxidoreductase [Candidatus Binataceae bacterium]